MPLVGVKLEKGGREWKVVATVRDGPEWRIVLKATDDPECKMIANTQPGSSPGGVADLQEALKTPSLRSFRDQQGALWKVEVTRRADDRNLQEDWLVFSAVARPDRLKWPSDSLQSLSAITDKELVKLLWEARSAQHTRGVG